MRTALKVRIEPEAGSVVARAGIGILGQQALPTVVSMLVFWPILVTQVWGAVQASKTDDEALRVIEEGLALAGGGGTGAAVPAPRAAGGGGFCGSCGAAHSGGKFWDELWLAPASGLTGGAAVRWCSRACPLPLPTRRRRHLALCDKYENPHLQEPTGTCTLGEQVLHCR